MAMPGETSERTPKLCAVVKKFLAEGTHCLHNPHLKRAPIMDSWENEWKLIRGCFMDGIFSYISPIYPKNGPNVRKYSMEHLGYENLGGKKTGLTHCRDINGN